MRKTQRGFLIYGEMKDSYYNTIRVQQSSSAMKECCWIFTKDQFGKEYTEHLGEISVRSPHLTKAQDRRLAKALLRFSEST